MKNNLILLFLSFLLPFLFSCSDDENVNINEREDGAYILNIDLSGSLQNPAFSPDGNSIIFTRFISGYNKGPAEIYKYDLVSKKLTLLVSDGNDNINLPGSSWLQGKITFSSSREPHDEIYIIDENGESGDEEKVTERNEYVSYEPTFNPSGEWIVFESHIVDVEDSGIITKKKLNGADYFNLTKNGDDCRQPNWSPAGDKIVYQKLENGQWDLWVTDTSGINHSKITEGTGNKTDASFSGDGQYIVFSSDYNLTYANIFKISISGKDLVQLTKYSSGYDGAPALSPDGSKLIFESCPEDPDESPGTRLYLLNISQ